jgi:hypothetical protein
MINDQATQDVYEIARQVLVDKLLPEYEAAHDDDVRDQAKQALSDALANTWNEHMTNDEWENAVRQRLGC